MSLNEELDGGVVFTYQAVTGVSSSGQPIYEERTTTIASYRTSILWNMLIRQMSERQDLPKACGQHVTLSQHSIFSEITLFENETEYIIKD